MSSRNLDRFGLAGDPLGVGAMSERAMTLAGKLASMLAAVLALLAAGWAYASGLRLVSVGILAGGLVVLVRRWYRGDRLIWFVLAVTALTNSIAMDLHVGSTSVGSVVTAGVGHLVHGGGWLLDLADQAMRALLRLLAAANQATGPGG
jgi:hypothetical protein